MKNRRKGMMKMQRINDYFKQSSLWMKRNARPLDNARWEYFFEGKSKENVIQYLSAFQNEDGGFGHGIEPDFWNPYSSPMATWAAAQVLYEIGANKDEPIVQSMIAYLIKTSDAETGMWESVRPENNDYPHAPWWSWKEGVQKNWMFNPGAELAAYLVHWAKDDEAEQIGWTSIEKAINHLMNKNEMDMHEVGNFQQLVQIMKQYEDPFNEKIPFTLEEVTKKVLDLVENSFEKEPSRWKTGYKALPVDFINHPSHPLYEKYESLVEENLKFFIEELLEEGAWDISWDWGTYPKDFPVARRYWQGNITVNRYKLFKAFGYLE